jgi:hypothetical protein
MALINIPISFESPKRKSDKNAETAVIKKKKGTKVVAETTNVPIWKVVSAKPAVATKKNPASKPIEFLVFQRLSDQATDLF